LFVYLFVMIAILFKILAILAGRVPDDP